jgi:glucose/arabinose dehydrogenase
VDQPFANHNGGDIEFGPDGWLYFGLGDGGSGGDPLGSGQDPTSLLGSMLRIQPTSSGYETEPGPFVGQGGRDEVWAMGLRNPWRFTFDRLTGDLWIGDVGQARVEEIDMVPFTRLFGANFGWNLREGDRPFGPAGTETSNLTEPIAVYGRDQGVSVTGGVVYRGSAIPGLFGAYLYSDFAQGWVRGLRQEDGLLTDNAQLADSVGNVAAYGQDHDGEVYILTLGGQVLRLVAG